MLDAKLHSALKSKRCAFNDKAINDFIYYLTEELPYWIMRGKDSEKLTITHRRLSEASKELEQSLTEFVKSVKEVRAKFHSINKLTDFFSLTVVDNFSAEDLLRNIQLYNTKLLECSPATKKGRNHLISSELAFEIAYAYMDYLSQKISSGNGRMTGNTECLKAKKTPFDRVCDAVSEYTGYQITNYHRKEAIKVLKARGANNAQKKS